MSLYCQNYEFQSYSQVLKSPEVTAWKESIAAELHVLQDKRRCWEIVPYPKGRHHNLLRCHFVFKVKMKDGRVDRYKSRLVVDGSKQVSGIDYTDNFAPVVKHTIVRMFLPLLLSIVCVFINWMWRVRSYMPLCMRTCIFTPTLL